MDSYKNRLLNVEYIQEKLDEGYKYTEEAKGQDLVLVIGNTGVGKSTTCNYLLGHHMREIFFNGKPVIETVVETDIKIGHEVKAETLYAKTVLVNEFPSLQSSQSNSCFCLLDCPGFLGNRTVEDSVIESISTELAVRNAKQIKGILILISINNLLETRVIELRELIKTLISLFKDPVEMVQYSIFVITKKYKLMPDSEAKAITIGALNSLKDHCEKQAKWLYEHKNMGSSEGLTYIDYDMIATYFSALLVKQDNIIIINPLDSGASQKLIFRLINCIKPRRGYLKELAKEGINLFKNTVGIENNQNQPLRPITINDFNFSEYDENRVKFNKTIYDRAHDGYLLINNIQKCRETIINLQLEVSNYQNRLSMLKQLQSNLVKEMHKTDEDKSQFSKIDFRSLKNLELIIVQNNKNIRSLENEVNTVFRLQETLRKELESIDNDNPLIFMQKGIYKYVYWFKLFGWEVVKFNAETGDEAVPIIKVDKEKANGKWLDEDDRSKGGVYKITYASNYRARPAKASVTAYIKTKDEAGNQIRIKEINEEISELNKKQEKLKIKIECLKCNSHTLQSTIELATSSKEAYKNNLKQKLKECDEDIQHHNCLIDKMQKDREEARLTGLASLQEFDSNKHKFDIVVSIAAVLEFPSLLIKRFVSQYNEFLSDIDTYRCIFDSNVNLDFFPRTRRNYNIVDLRDPITGDEITDLVVTKSGTLFDLQSLLKKFDTTKDDKLPFVFEHGDGSLEEIEFLSWQRIPDIQSYLNKQRNLKFLQASSSSSFTKSEINQMTSDQLSEQRDGLQQEIQEMREQLEVKQTELEKICRQLKKVTSIEEGGENLLSFYSKSEIIQKTVDQFGEQTCSEEIKNVRLEKPEFENSFSAAQNGAANAAVLDSHFLHKFEQEIQTSENSCSNQRNQESEVEEIPSDNRLLLNSLSNKLDNQDFEKTESLFGFEVIPNNIDLKITNLDNEQFSEVVNTDNSIKSAKSFGSSETIDDNNVSENGMLNEDNCVFKCPCGEVKNTVTFPCQHFYFCDKCAPKFFEFYHRCPICKNRIKSYDKIF